MYSVAGGDPQLGTAGALYTNVGNPAVNPATGGEIPDYTMPGGGRRRRGTRKGRGRMSRMSRRRRSMRGGASFAGAGQVGYGYAGTGSGGLANVAGYSVHSAGGGPSIGADGVSRV
jgi:hypothetical protein